MTKAPRPPVGPSAHRLALMLAQVGALAAGRFAKRIAELDLTPAHADVLRVIATDPGRSHQSLSASVGHGAGPARRDPRRPREAGPDRAPPARAGPAPGRPVSHAVRQQFMGRLAAAGAEHERDITGALSDEERRALGAILEKLAQAHGMTTGPGFGYRGTTTRSDGAGSHGPPPAPTLTRSSRSRANAGSGSRRRDESLEQPGVRAGLRMPLHAERGTRRPG